MKNRKYIFWILLSALLLMGCTNAGTQHLIEGRGITTSSGMVVSAHPDASRIGAEILQKGGNAIDAAVATEFALAVCYPEAGNIGGGGFMVIRLADGQTDVIDYREVAPGMASRDMFLDNKGNVIPGLSSGSHLASGVPGTVDGMINAHSHYGKLSFRDVIQPSIDLANKGFHLTKLQADDLNGNRQNFIDMNAASTVFVRDSLWKEGDLLIQSELAGTLERIRDNGREGFYSGETATMIVRETQRGKGLISVEDLNKYRSVSREPLKGDYRGYHIITVPPPSSGGIILLQLLGMVEPFSLKAMGFKSAAAIHVMTEAERRSFADRAEYLGDPDFMKLPASTLLDKRYLVKRMSDFNPGKASLSSDIQAGSPKESDQTTHYSVVDAEGNAVSATTTLNGGFGNSVVVQGAGFLMNNQMDDFSIKPGFPNMYGVIGGEVNSIAPGKKMLSSMTPVIVEKEGKLFLVAGSPGGSTIPTTVFQVITNVVDFGMDIHAAVDSGRFHHQWLPDQIVFEKGRIDSGTLDSLQLMGHSLKETRSMGRVNAIMITSDGLKSAGADRRGDNTACGY